MNSSDKETKLSYKGEVLPWLCGIFLGRTQTSDIRVSEVCQALILALENRLVTVYRCPMVKRDEVLVKCTNRGQKVLDQNTSNRISFSPEIGCDDESLGKYFSCSTQIYMEDLVKMYTQSSVLDDMLNLISILEH